MYSLAIWSSLLVLACATAAETKEQATPTVELSSGTVVGIQTVLPSALGPVNKFLGIPYASSPPERFAAPKAPKKWQGSLKVDKFRDSCLQYLVENELALEPDIVRKIVGVTVPESEDCLYVNVYAPAEPGAPHGRPVLLFIAGGGWMAGNGLIDLSGFAGYEDILAVTFSYRTNVFGYGNVQDLPIEERNPGLLDQQLALKWVQENIAPFGGDPTKITLWGESAGAMSVDLHMLTYHNDEDTPFRAAILSSGQMSHGLLGSNTSPTDNDTQWSTLSAKVGCDDKEEHLECMRNASIDEILDSIEELGLLFAPVVDNVTVTPGRAQQWRDGRVARVPVLMSTLAEEGRALVNTNVNLDLFVENYLSETFVPKEVKGDVLNYYKGREDLETDYDVAAAIYTDFLLQCPQAKQANLSSHCNPTWRFYINATLAQDFLPSSLDSLGKFHGSDITLLFSSPTFEPGETGLLEFSPQTYALAVYLRGLLARFVKNPEAGPGWLKMGDDEAGVFDVVTLGDVGGEKGMAGVAAVDREKLDEACGLFESVYEMLEKVF